MGDNLSKMGFELTSELGGRVVGESNCCEIRVQRRKVMVNCPMVCGSWNVYNVLGYGIFSGIKNGYLGVGLCYLGIFS